MPTFVLPLSLFLSLVLCSFATVRIFPQHLDPSLNAQSKRHFSKAPSFERFPANVTQFVAYRGGCDANEFDQYLGMLLSIVWR
jgi:hypothetical protein